MTRDISASASASASPPGASRGPTTCCTDRHGPSESALDVAIEVAADAVEVIALEGVDAAMLRFNGDAGS